MPEDAALPQALDVHAETSRGVSVSACVDVNVFSFTVLLFYSEKHDSVLTERVKMFHMRTFPLQA